jgi:hypothetical protein
MEKDEQVAEDSKVETPYPSIPGQGRRNFIKQKIALFFGYNGTAYHGLQKQK